MEERRHERFGRYEVLAELGRGAMGVVYKARDPKINRVVAVKTVCLSGQPPEEEKEYRERFFREAEAAGRLSHPGIVTIFDVGEEPETRAPYIVMEFVAGQSLDKLLARDDHKLPLDKALQLTLELAEALDCAHGQGVVHRDLKPANILITEEGSAKIADFGVAKLNLANHTLSGRALGTPAFMSPEQLSGEEVDGRSDLFSLGVVLYTVLTGYRPFQGNSAMTVSFKVVNRDPIPATVLDTELPPGLDYIISRAMAKDPALRYQRGMEMVLDVQDLKEGRQPRSKTQLDSALGTSQTAKDKDRVRPSTAGQRGPSSKHRASGDPRSPEQQAAAKMMAQLRKGSLAGAMLVFGLLLLGVRVGNVVWPQPAPLQRMAGAKATTLQPHTDVGPSKAPAEPILHTPRKAALVARTHPLPAKAVHSSSPAVSAIPAPLPSPAASPSSTGSSALLEIEVDHKFAAANLSIWVDDRLAFTHTLEGESKKHLVVFHHVQGHEVHAMQISAGKHVLRVQVSAGAVTPDPSATLAAEFVGGTEKLLRIQFSKSGQMSLSLQ